MHIGDKDITWISFPLDDPEEVVIAIPVGIPVKVPQETGLPLEDERPYIIIERSK